MAALGVREALKLPLHIPALQVPLVSTSRRTSPGVCLPACGGGVSAPSPHSWISSQSLGSLGSLSLESTKSPKYEVSLWAGGGLRRGGWGSRNPSAPAQSLELGKKWNEEGGGKLAAAGWAGQGWADPSPARGGTPGGAREPSPKEDQTRRGEMAGTGLGGRLYRQIKRHPAVSWMILTPNFFRSPSAPSSLLPSPPRVLTSTPPASAPPPPCPLHPPRRGLLWGEGQSRGCGA